MTPRLLSGPPDAAGRRVAGRASCPPGGAAAPDGAAPAILPVLDAAGLLGRGGAGFPVARKWASVAERGDGNAIVLANGAEGEPLSAKDQVLMAARPHLVLDGAELAADAVGARRIVLYVGAEHGHALAALERAHDERRAVRGRGASAIPVEFVAPPRSYIAGEESAAVHFVNEGDARPTSTPPRPFERGVDGRPTLVQNVESLAHAALIARFGDQWYREAGRGETRGTALFTVSGAPQSGVVELESGTTLAERRGDRRRPGRRGARPARRLLRGLGRRRRGVAAPLDPTDLRQAGRAFGCGVVSFLGERRAASGSRHRSWTSWPGRAPRSAGRACSACAPSPTRRRALRTAVPVTTTCIGSAGWSETLAGRGACRHPDGAVGLVRSALRVFDAEFGRHQRNRRCVTGERALERRLMSASDRFRGSGARPRAGHRPDRLRRVRELRRAAAGDDRAR